MSDHPRLLILETSGRIGQVALAAGAQLLARRTLDETRRHARDLAPAVAELLAGQGWRPRAVEAVVVSRGPGSYTGLRIGVMSAKVFAYATGCALLALDTLAAVALRAPAEATHLDVLADAQQDRVYVQSFTRGSTGYTPRSPLAIRSFAEWLAQREPEAWVTGPGLRKWRDALPPDVAVVAAELCEPDVDSLLRLGLERYRAGERDDPWTAEPLYLRPSAAEEQWQARQAGPA